ncbi:cation:proton antiporter [Frisingicoccus sp.]|uniref:cation:proton antiporter n=1 Tax=Frisingicoccus sp. TaxID=1918627 RepID=UPI00373575BC
MLNSLALIFLAGLSLAAICQRIKLPRIIGMLMTGIILGPFVLNLFDPSILGISSELRQMALVIILIKAGLSLNISDLKKVGRPAILMSFLPAVFEILAFVFLAPTILKVTRIEALIIGAVLGAVSPAVVVPRMVQLMEEKYGTNKSIPQMILAGASLDDVFVIVLFTTFIGMAQGESASVMDFINIPVSIISGILIGAAAGFFLAWFFETNYSHKNLVRNSMKVIIVLGTSFLLLAVEEWLENILPVSGLLAIMSMAMVLAMRSVPEVTKRLQEKYGKLWIAAEVILFALVGAAVDIRYTLEAGAGAVLMIFIGLICRSIGTWLCMLGTNLNKKEKLYCVIAYLPKATVQAAIGSVPLSLGLPCGNIVLSVAVLSILITAPLGAIGMDLSYKKLLTK